MTRFDFDVISDAPQFKSRQPEATPLDSVAKKAAAPEQGDLREPEDGALRENAA